jgi:hypothetical protein
MLVRLHLREEDQPQPKHAREYDAHHRILFHAAVLLEVAGQQRTREPRGERADGERQAEHEREHHPRQHGMRDRIAHQRPALEHQIAGQHRADRTDEDGGNERPLHEAVAQWHGKEVPKLTHGIAPSEAAGRRRAASTPCLGAK